MTRARILIVEDEILIAREIESCLCQIGYTVVGVALQGEVVPQQIVETEPDLVLMDIYLQGAQDGIALAAEIHDRYQIPVIYVTAYADDDTLEQAKVTHPFGYVIKPFNERDLRVAIELALARLQARAAEQLEVLTTTPSIESQTSGLPPHKLKKIIHYINNNLDQELSLDNLANEVSMNSYYFARLFKQSVGKSVHQYIIHRRVERAKQLLRQSERAVAEIAIDCGFSNASHLALHFKRIVGISPKKFRHF